MPTHALREPHPHFVIVLWCLLVHETHTLSLMCMYAQNPIIIRLVLSHVHQLIAVAGPMSATLAVCQLQMGLLLCKAHALDLCKATPTFSKHVLVPVKLLEPHTVLCYLFIAIAIIIIVGYNIPTIR